MSATDALAGERDRSMKLPLPTIRNLKNIKHCTSIDQLLDWADARRREGIIKLRPIFLKENGKSKWVVPGDSDYPVGGDGYE